MFEFTTQTVLNSIVKTTENDVRDKKAPKGYNIITKDSAKGPEVRINHIRFNKEDILDIQEINHTPEHFAKTEIDIAKLIELVTADGKDTQEGNYRIILYVTLSMNSQDSYYSNDFVYKGKPFFLEFPIKAADSPEDVAKRLVKIVNRYQLLMTEHKIIDVRADEGKVILEATNGYQQFRDVDVQKYDPNAKQIDCCNNNGDFITIMKGVLVNYLMENGEFAAGDQTLDFDGLRELADDEFAIEPGLEAFLDYSWIIHNLRLPTETNTNFWTGNREMPVVGGEYTQFIVRMCKERDGIAGEVVGQRAKSVTTHVFYVLDQGTNVATIETELGKLATIKKDAEEALADPYAGAQ